MSQADIKTADLRKHSLQNLEEAVIRILRDTFSATICFCSDAASKHGCKLTRILDTPISSRFHCLCVGTSALTELGNCIISQNFRDSNYITCKIMIRMSWMLIFERCESGRALRDLPS